jgi:hypothetical protein
MAYAWLFVIKVWFPKPHNYVGYLNIRQSPRKNLYQGAADNQQLAS